MKSEEMAKGYTIAQPVFEAMMSHLVDLSTIHGNIDPQTPKGEELLEKVEARMLDILNHLPEGQV